MAVITDNDWVNYLSKLSKLTIEMFTCYKVTFFHFLGKTLFAKATAKEAEMLFIKLDVAMLTDKLHYFH
jgi:hypothetical protein